MKIFSFILVCSLMVFQVACAQKSEKINGQGATVTKTLNLDKFDGLGLGVNATINLTQGPQSVSIKAQQNIINNIKTAVKNGSWNIEFDKRVNNHTDIIINISMPTITGLSIGGSGEILGKSNFNGLGNLSLAIGGSGIIDLAGSAKDVEISIAGSGDVKTANLSAANCEVSIAGSGDAYIEVSNDLDVSIAGSGNVHYKGRPKVNSSIAGSGKVKSM